MLAHSPATLPRDTATKQTLLDLPSAQLDLE